MTDVLSRLPEAEESTERRGLSRRQLIKAGAWAAPVIVLATATPAAAASVDVADHIAQAITLNTLSAYDESAPGRIRGSANLQYDGNAFGQWPILAPDSVIVIWRLVVVNQSTGMTTTALADTTSVIPKYNSTGEHPYVVNGLTAGAYTIRLQLISVTFSPSPAPQANRGTATFASPLTTFETTLNVT